MLGKQGVQFFAGRLPNALGRLIERRENRRTAPGSYVSEPTAIWRYDDALLIGTTTKAVGLLIEQSNGLASTQLAYDGFGRSASVTTNLEGTVYYQRTTYDKYGRVFQSFDASTSPTSPAGQLQVYSLDGYPIGVREAANGLVGIVYSEVLALSARQQVRRERYHESANLVSERSFDDNSGRLATISTGIGGTLQQWDYRWDKNGNLTQRWDRSNGADWQEQFLYDPLDRLTQVTQTRSNGVPTNLTTLALSYDQLGNITQKTGLGAANLGAYAYKSTPAQTGCTLIAGPHAAHLIDLATTRDVEKIYPGKSAYACMLNEAGKFTDDCIIYRLSPNSWMVVHGSGTGHEELTKAAMGRDVSIRFDDNLHDLSLQGPLAVDYLQKHVPGIRDLPYFHHMQTQLFGLPVMISRTGYTGERGYELFVGSKDVVYLWDTILERGESIGIIPCRFTVLDMLRVESYLLFYPYDNSQMYPYAKPDSVGGDSLWELGLDFTVSPGKTGFRGAERHYALKGRERMKIFGVLAQTDQPTDGGDELWSGSSKVGVITCGMVSKLTHRSMAIARFDPAYAVQGTRLEIRGKNVSCPAIAHTLTFDDPEKKKRTVVGRG